jgi:hypothetical protein
LDTQSVTWTQGEIKEFTFTNTTAYRYYQLYYTAIQTDDEAHLSELQAYTVAYSELKVRDEQGNTTTLSPHNFRNIPKELRHKIKDASDGLAWTYHSEKDGKEI